MDTINRKRRWVMLGVAYLCVLVYAIALQSVPPVLSLVMDELRLSHAQGGLLMSLFALPGIFISIPAGLLADRYGQRVIGLVAFGLTVAGTVIFATGSSLPILAVGRVVAGTGAIALMVLGPQLLGQWFNEREIGMAMGIFNTGFLLGTVLTMNFLSIIGQSLGWRVSIWLTAGVALAALIVFAIIFTSAPRRVQPAPSRPESFLLGIRRAGTPIWLVGIAWLLFNAAMISLFTFTPDLLKSNGFSIASAGLITSAIMWSSLATSLIAGFVIDRVGHKLTIIAVSSVLLAFLITLVPTTTGWILALMLAIGVCQTLIPVPVFALPPDVTSRERLGLAFGILSACLNLGILFGPATVGLIRDVTGSYQVSYLMMAGLAFLVALVMPILRWAQKHLPP
ncbi:MAG: MFS transporter [Chloroflexota bacterium]|nr:MFS transporter [Chloroflexota bacterium]